MFFKKKRTRKSEIKRLREENRYYKAIQDNLIKLSEEKAERMRIKANFERMNVYYSEL